MNINGAIISNPENEEMSETNHKRLNEALAIKAELIRLSETGHNFYDGTERLTGNWVFEDPDGVFVIHMMYKGKRGNTCTIMYFEARMDWDHGLHNDESLWNEFSDIRVVHPDNFIKFAERAL